MQREISPKALIAVIASLVVVIALVYYWFFGRHSKPFDITKGHFSPPKGWAIPGGHGPPGTQGNPSAGGFGGKSGTGQAAQGTQ